MHTKHSCLSSVPSWEPSLEHAGKKQRDLELELPASFPRLENPSLLFLPVLMYQSLLLVTSSTVFSCKIQPMLLFPPPAGNLHRGDTP